MDRLTESTIIPWLTPSVPSVAVSIKIMFPFSLKHNALKLKLLFMGT